MKSMSFIFAACAIGSILLPAPVLAANEFLLLDKDKNHANLPSTDEYKNFHPGLMMTDDNGQKTQNLNDDKDAASVQVTVDDSSDQKILTLDAIVSKYRVGEFDGLKEPLQTLAAGGNAQADEILGVMYYGGKGIEHDPAKAFEHFSRAAENNRVVAQHHLGVMYFTGEGTLPDPVKSLMWLHIAIAHYQDSPEKKRALEDRDNIFVRLTRREKERALEMAREWLSARGEAHLLDFQ